MGGCVSSDMDGGKANGSDKRGTSKKGRDTETNILLLGTHQAGKSTIARQLAFAYAAPLDDHQRAYMVSIIHNNLISTVQVLCKEAHKYGSITVDSEDAFTYFVNKCQSDVIDDVVTGYIRKLWNETAIRSAWEHRSSFYLRNPHNIQWFFDKLQEVTSGEYTPSDDDILRIAVRTTAFNTIQFQQGGLTFHIQDVGGLRSERPRWPQRNQSVGVVLFVVNISEYDQYLLEDPSKLRLAESLTLFNDLNKTGYFKQVPVILIFTHMDIFVEKIQSRDLSSTFPDYDGPSHDADSAKAWIEKQFTSQLQNTPDEAQQGTAQSATATTVNCTTHYINALELDKVKACVSSVVNKGSGISLQ